MSNTLKLSILVFILLLPLAYYGTQKYFKVPPPVVPPVATFVQVDEHLTIDETLKEVNFCGTTYKVKQVKIDGVDVVQRVAELAPQNERTQKSICANAKSNPQQTLLIEGVNPNLINPDWTRPKKNIYGVYLQVLPFSVDTNTGNIYAIDTSGFGGESILLGKLK